MNEPITFADVLESGVYIIIPLALLFVATIWILCVRWKTVTSELQPPFTLMQRIRDYIVEGDIENARQLCENSDSGAARILTRGVSRIGYPIAEVADSIYEILNVENMKLEKGLRWLRAIAVISPLLGAIGTLIGCTIAFGNSTDEAGLFDGAILCNNLSPTFITLVCGLGVGIAALFAFTLLEGVVQKTQTRLSSLCVEFLDLLNQPS